MIAIGAVAERGRLGPALAFVFIWATIVYDPIACWTWNRNGWSDSLGVLDFAGGTPVPISSFLPANTNNNVYQARQYIFPRVPPHLLFRFTFLNAEVTERTTFHIHRTIRPTLFSVPYFCGSVGSDLMEVLFLQH
jgi:hypothetical protein